MLTTSACHQNQSNSDAIRQYAKRRTTVQLPPSLPFLIITIYVQKIISHLG